MNAHQPVFSVIIPTRDRCRYLRQAIDSVLAQSFGRFELIVVDDASTDTTPALLNAIDDCRVVSVRHERPGGASAARNSGIRRARGVYLAFLDDDDWWHTNKLGEQWHAFEQSRGQLGLLYSDCELVCGRTGQFIKTSHGAARGRILERTLHSCVLKSPTPVIPRRCLDVVGVFDERFPSCQDREMWVRMAERFEFDYLPKITAVHRVHSGQMTTNRQVKVMGKQLLYEKFRALFARYPETHCKQLWTLSNLHIASGDARRGRGFLRDLCETGGGKSYRPWLQYFLALLAPRRYRYLCEGRFERIGSVVHYY